MVRPERANWLDKAIARTVPGEPPQPDYAAWRQAHPEALEALAQRARANDHSPLRHHAGRPALIEFGRRIMRSPIGRLAIAATIVLVVLGSIHYLGGSIDGTSRAFADICRNVTQASTVRFVTRSATLTAQIYEKDGYLVRTELQAPGPMQFDTILMDKRAGNYLYMDSQRKVAWHPSGEFRDATSNIYELFTNYLHMPGYSVKKLGKERIGDRLSLGFRVTMRDEDLGLLQHDIWTDPETRLPIRIDFTGHAPDGQTLELVTTDIVFDEPLDDALFDFEPEGFQIIDESDLQAPATEEQQTSAAPVLEGASESEPATTDVESNTASVETPAAAEPQTGVAGIVLDKLTQKPIAGALIGYRSYGTPNVVHTDASGRFLWTGLAPSEQKYVSVIAKGHASKRIVTRVIQGQVTKSVRIELDRSSRVAGTVTDPEGHPITGAAVESFHFTNRPAVTDADGRFEIDGLSPVVDSYSLHATHPDYPAVSLEFSPGAVGQTVYQDVILKPGADVFGRVTDPNGQPLAGVTVGNTTSQAMWNSITAETDGEGRYRLENVDLGELVLWAVDPNHALHVQRRMIADGTSEEKIDIQLQAAVPLRGRIVDQAGDPVPGVQVVISEYNDASNLARNRYTSDANGWFVIPNAPSEGTVRLNPFGGGISGEIQEFELGQEEYTVVVRRAGRIYGKVLAEATGEPVTEFTVKMTATEVGERSRGYQAMWAREGVMVRSSEGQFDTRVDDLAVGSAYRMTVFAQGYDALTLDPVVVQPISEDPNRTVFRLKPATLIAGVVVDTQENPIERAMVAVFAKSERHEPAHWRKFETDAAGIFLIAGAGNDQRYVYITAPGFAPHYSIKSDLETDGDAPAKVVLSRGATVFGTVTDERSQVRAGMTVRVQKTHNEEKRLSDYPYPVTNRDTRTDTNGYYELSGLPVGWCTIWLISNANDTLATKKVRLVPGETTQLDFGSEEGFLITGIVRRGSSPIADADVALYGVGNDSKHALTDSQGRFVLGRMPGGRTRLVIQWANPEPSRSRGRQESERRTIIIDRDADLDLDLGAGSIGGSVPASLKGQEGLRISIRRWVEHPAPDHQGIVNSWENAHQAKRATQIDADGSFRCGGLRAGRYHLVLSYKMRVRGITDIFEMGESQDLQGMTFQTGQGQLDIRILDALTGQGLDAARFTVQNDLELRFWDRREVSDGRGSRMVTNAQGAALHEGLPPGRYQISAWAHGYLPTTSDFIALGSAETRSVTVALANAAMATFDLSADLRTRVKTDSVLIKCRVTDLNSGQLVLSQKASGTSNQHGVSISLEQPESTIGSALHLPEERYRIDYALRPYNTVERVLEMSIYEGTVTVELTTGQTQAILLDD
jgi:outer membrane lipoprotein-sorting protein